MTNDVFLKGLFSNDAQLMDSYEKMKNIKNFLKTSPLSFNMLPTEQIFCNIFNMFDCV